jgi:hypothetical protein
MQEDYIPASWHVDEFQRIIENLSPMNDPLIYALATLQAAEGRLTNVYDVHKLTSLFLVLSMTIIVTPVKP